MRGWLTHSVRVSHALARGVVCWRIIMEIENMNSAYRDWCTLYLCIQKCIRSIWNARAHVMAISCLATHYHHPQPPPLTDNRWQCLSELKPIKIDQICSQRVKGLFAFDYFDISLYVLYIQIYLCTSLYIGTYVCIFDDGYNKNILIKFHTLVSRAKAVIVCGRGGAKL